MSAASKMYGDYASETYKKYGVFYRRCVFCGEEKVLTDFPKNGVNAAGQTEYRQDCKVCYNIRRKENRNKKKHNDFIGGQKRRGEKDVTFSHQEWKEALIYFGGACVYCGCTVKKGQRLTKDHLVPLSKGGKTVAANIVPACATCNCSKGASEWREWFMRQPFFSQDRMNKIFNWRTILQQLEGGREDE